MIKHKHPITPLYIISQNTHSYRFAGVNEDGNGENTDAFQNESQEINDGSQHGEIVFYIEF